MKSTVSKRLHLFLLSICCLLSFLTAPAATVSLRIMTYNDPEEDGGVDQQGPRLHSGREVGGKHGKRHRRGPRGGEQRPQSQVDQDQEGQGKAPA